MCQLFPYTFTPTPTGVYASLSFASTAVLFNSGRLLSEQGELLEKKWQLFQSLMPNYAPNWDTMQIVDGAPLAWQTFLPIDQNLLSLFAVGDEPGENQINKGNSNLLDRLNQASGQCCSLAPRGHIFEKNLTDARPKTVDQILIKYLLEFYFPTDVFSESSVDLPIRTIAEQLVKPPSSVRLPGSGTEIGFSDLLNTRLGKLDDDCESLLTRFVYCRLFSKLYFAAGFNNLSLVAGFHHLVLLVALIRIQFKMLGLSADAKAKDVTYLAEIVRVLERRLTTARFGRQSSVMLEVLLSSPSRIERILSIAS
jgi:hypothetical protein